MVVFYLGEVVVARRCYSYTLDLNLNCAEGSDGMMRRGDTIGESDGDALTWTCLTVMHLLGLAERSSLGDTIHLDLRKDHQCMR
jgi:hypothetical protein